MARFDLNGFPDSEEGFSAAYHALAEDTITLHNLEYVNWFRDGKMKLDKPVELYGNALWLNRQNGTQWFFMDDGRDFVRCIVDVPGLEEILSFDNIVHAGETRKKKIRVYGSVEHNNGRIPQAEDDPIIIVKAVYGCEEFPQALYHQGGVVRQFVRDD